MSGRKYTKVEIQDKIRDVLNCQLQVKEAYTKAKSFVNTLSEMSLTTVSLKDLVTSAKSVLNHIQCQIESMNTLVEESEMIKLTMSDIQKNTKMIEQLKFQLEDIIDKCREGKNASSKRNELLMLFHQLINERDLLCPWLQENIYERFVDEIKDMLKNADNEITKTGSIEGIAEKIPNQLARYKKMKEKAIHSKQLDLERRYIASSIEIICNEMGFASKWLSQENLFDDLIMEVKTHAYGIITFRLQLDGTIRSNSEIDKGSCCSNYIQIEDKLKSFGLDSEFKYEEDDQPIRQEKNEQPYEGEPYKIEQPLTIGAKMP